MTIFFCNKEPIDLNAIALMGVSVKTNNNPIGFFGTGLKYAIATLLRTNHRVFLHRAGQHIDFRVQKETIRGEEFDRIVMNDEKLGFTTRLGKNWEPWQAYRELYCNALDEGGVITDEKPANIEDFGTIFAIQGDDIERCHRDRAAIFIDTAPLFKDEHAEIHRNKDIYERDVFYRGVRAGKIDRPALYTYNILQNLTLTEDRTIKYSWNINNAISKTIPQLDDEGMLERILLAPVGSFEAGLDYYDEFVKPSLAFMDICFRLRMNMKANRSAIRLWEKHADRRVAFKDVLLDQFEERALDKAFILLARLGCKADRGDLCIVESLGDNIFGAVRDSQIMISHAAFDHGYRYLASTIYEEYLHRDHQKQDESRELQNFLFEKLFAMTEKVAEMEGKI